MKIPVNRASIFAAALLSALLVSCCECAETVMIATNSDGDRVTLNCSSEHLSIQIDTYIDADVQDLDLTCTTGEPVDVWWWYLTDTRPGPSQGGAISSDRISLAEHGVKPGSVCTVEDGRYTEAGGDITRWHDLPVVECTVPALPPNVTDVTVGEGDELNLTCINNNPSQSGVSQEWRDSEGMFLSNESSLLVESVTRSFSGAYSCVLTGANNYTVMKNATVTVEYAPEVNTSNPTSQNVSVGGTAVLSCDYDGVPTPTVRWLHNGDELGNGTENVEIINEGGQSVLTLRNIGRQGGGNYSCEANNSRGEDVSTVTLETIAEDESATTGTTSMEADFLTSFTTTSSSSEAELLAVVGILIPTLVLSMVAAVVVTLVILWRRRQKTRKYSNYHIHFHLHSEFDRNYEPVKLEVANKFSKSLETILHARSFSDEDTHSYSELEVQKPQDIESVTSQQFEELDILKPNEVTSLNSNSYCTCEFGAIACDSTTSQNAHSNNCSGVSHRELFEKSCTRRHSASVDLQSDYVSVELDEYRLEHRDLEDTESESGSEILHHSTNCEAQIVSDNDTVSACDSLMLSHQDPNNTSPMMSDAYIDVCPHFDNQHTLSEDDDSSIMLGTESGSCRNNFDSQDTLGDPLMDATPFGVDKDIAIASTLDYVANSSIGYVEMDRDINEEEHQVGLGSCHNTNADSTSQLNLVLESDEEDEESRFQLSDSLHIPTHLCVSSQSPISDYIPESEHSVVTSRFNITFTSTNTNQHNQFGYVTSSSESDYYSSCQIPLSASECGSNYYPVVGHTLEESNDNFSLGADEFLSHPVQQKNSLITNGSDCHNYTFQDSSVDQDLKSRPASANDSGYRQDTDTFTVEPTLTFTQHVPSETSSDSVQSNHEPCPNSTQYIYTEENHIISFPEASTITERNVALQTKNNLNSSSNGRSPTSDCVLSTPLTLNLDNIPPSDCGGERLNTCDSGIYTPDSSSSYVVMDTGLKFLHTGIALSPDDTSPAHPGLNWPCAMHVDKHMYSHGRDDDELSGRMCHELEAEAVSFAPEQHRDGYVQIDT